MTINSNLSALTVFFLFWSTLPRNNLCDSAFDELESRPYSSQETAEWNLEQKEGIFRIFHNKSLDDAYKVLSYEIEDEEYMSRLNEAPHSVTDSIEFMLDHYKKALQSSKELDDLLEKVTITLAPDFSTWMDAIDEGMRRVGQFTSQTKALMKLGRSGKISKQKYNAELDKIENEKVQVIAKDIGSRLMKLAEGGTVDTYKLSAIYKKQRAHIDDEIGKYNDMAREYLRNLFGLRHYIKIRVGDVVDDSIISFDLDVIEQLLELWKKLEGARNQVLIETDPEKKSQINAQITELDKNLNNFLKDNESEINNFVTEGFRLVSRNRDKMHLLSDKVDQRNEEIGNVAAISDASIIKLDNFNDLLRVADRVGKKLKDEL